MKDKRTDMIASLFPKAGHLDKPEVVDFINSLPQTFSEAEKSLSSNNRCVD